MKPEMKVHVVAHDYNNVYDFQFITPLPNGGRICAAPLQLKTIDSDATIENPAFQLTRAQAQQLLDQLWAAGLRPMVVKGNF